MEKDRDFSRALATNMARLNGGRSVGGLRSDMANAGYSIGQGTLDRILKGDKGVRMESLQKVADFFQTEVDLLMKDGESSSPFVEVRRADVRFSNGHGEVFYQEDDRPPLTFRVDFLRKLGIAKGDAVVVDSVGISNEPKIPDGSVTLINRGDRERLDGGFFAFRYDGHLLIKRLEALPEIGILATAENSNFTPKQKIYRGPDLDQFEVIGRAVWVGATL